MCKWQGVCKRSKIQASKILHFRFKLKTHFYSELKIKVSVKLKKDNDVFLWGLNEVVKKHDVKGVWTQDLYIRKIIINLQSNLLCHSLLLSETYLRIESKRLLCDWQSKVFIKNHLTNLIITISFYGKNVLSLYENFKIPSLIFELNAVQNQTDSWMDVWTDKPTTICSLFREQRNKLNLLFLIISKEAG